MHKRCSGVRRTPCGGAGGCVKYLCNMINESQYEIMGFSISLSPTNSRRRHFRASAAGKGNY